MPPTYTTPSTKYGIHRIDGSTNVSDIDAALNQAVDDVDATMAGYAEGTLSARSGVAATAGKLYRTTDTGQVFMGTGSAWIEIGVTPWYVGDLKWSWGTVDHGAWLLCDGRNVSRTTYAALFAWMGVSAGAGDGSTTFGIPDFRGRTLVMPDGTAGRMASGDDRGAAGGEELHTLTLSELPAHVHTANGAPGGTTAAAGGAVGPFQNQQDGRSTSAIGSGSAHNNMPPYAVAGGVFIRIM
jgi:microcystin-dependent protein